MTPIVALKLLFAVLRTRCKGYHLILVQEVTFEVQYHTTLVVFMGIVIVVLVPNQVPAS
jgi:hypothetical protein